MSANDRRQMRRRERALASRCAVMARLIEAAGPCMLEPRLERTPFESLARAIAHQQLNGTAAERILGRFTALYAPAAFPTPEALLATDEAALRACGFSFGKIRALRDLATKVHAGVVPARDELPALADDEIVTRITQVRGIGRWTVEMLLMFQLGRRDVLPVDDFGVCNGLRLAYGLRGMPRPKALAKFGERFAPERTLAAWYLWRAVDLHRAGKLPAPRGKPPRIEQVKKRAKVAAKALPKANAKANAKASGRPKAKARGAAAPKRQRKPAHARPGS
jgi:DNA-3-methyladenine glycosylase II